MLRSVSTAILGPLEAISGNFKPMGRHVLGPSIIEIDPIPRSGHVTRDRSRPATKTGCAFFSAPNPCAVCELAIPGRRFLCFCLPLSYCLLRFTPYPTCKIGITKCFQLHCAL